MPSTAEASASGGKITTSNGRKNRIWAHLSILGGGTIRPRLIIHPVITETSDVATAVNGIPALRAVRVNGSEMKTYGLGRLSGASNVVAIASNSNETDSMLQTLCHNALGPNCSRHSASGTIAIAPSNPVSIHWAQRMANDDPVDQLSRPAPKNPPKNVGMTPAWNRASRV
jgi:hypothetical protein